MQARGAGPRPETNTQGGAGRSSRNRLRTAQAHRFAHRWSTGDTDLKIAVASQNRRTITGHAGKCRRFWVYSIESGSITDRDMLELAMDQTYHASHGAGRHPLNGINALICRGMGSAMHARLREKGIDGLITDETDPDRAVLAYLQGRLPARQPALQQNPRQ